jgi:hypothetical protein
MPRRLLNIASIVCLVLCVALMGMWVRSYYYRYSLEMRFDSRLLQFVLDRGVLTYWDMHPITTKADVTVMLDDMSQHETFVSSIVEPRESAPFPGIVLGFGLERRAWSIDVSVPYWFLVLVSGSLAMAFQLRWPPQFTLRSLFIATTFLAVVLGMIVWLDRAWIGK